MCEISVVMTSYNRSGSIKKAIDSVLYALEGIDYELIIVDDGSTDGSIAIINKYNSPRIRKFLIAHTGMLSAYYLGISAVRGEFFTFADCDDRWNKKEIVRQLATMKGLKLNFSVTRCYVDRNGNLSISKKKITELRRALTYNNLLRGKAEVHAQTYMIRTEKFKEYIDFSKFLKFNTWDLPILLEWMQHDRIYYLDIITAVFCVQEESTTKTNSRKRRLKYLLGNYKIKRYFIKMYGCKLSTRAYLIYKFIRNTYSIIFKRWNK